MSIDYPYLTRVMRPVVTVSVVAAASLIGDSHEFSSRARLAPVAEAEGPNRLRENSDSRPPYLLLAPDGLPSLTRREFYFTRATYTDLGSRFRGTWSTDYPKADLQFLIGLTRLTNIDAFESENAVPLDDPSLRQFPFLYAVEVGYMSLTESEVSGLRDYLEAGGFLVVDDFWGTLEWNNFERELRRVIPDAVIEELPLDHPLLSTFYDIGEILQVPNVQNGIQGVRTHERDGFVPALRGVYDEDGRLVIVINWNTDLGDAWEWAENPYYPLRFSNFAYQLGVNLILYAMTH